MSSKDVELIFERHLKRIERQAPEHVDKFKVVFTQWPNQECARFAYRILETHPENFSKYITLVQFFYAHSPWVSSCVAENISYVINNEDKLESYVKLVEKALTINEWIAGEVADVTAQFLELNDNVNIFWEIIKEFSKAEKQWIAVEGIGYVVDGLKLTDDKDQFLLNVLEETKKNAIEGARFARSMPTEITSVDKEGDVVRVNPAYDRLTHWEEDKGHFNISVYHDAGIIECKYYGNDQKLKLAFEGAKAFNIYNKIHDMKLVTKYDHASWLGHELTRAEIALREGIEFRQDRELDFTKKWM